jgi:hypothetical protein
MASVGYPISRTERPIPPFNANQRKCPKDVMRDQPRLVGWRGSGGQRLGPRDQLEQWFVERACDGFVVAATHLPRAFEDLVRLVVAELQRRGLYHRDYEGLTLRETLRLGLPQPGTWM